MNNKLTSKQKKILLILIIGLTLIDSNSSDPNHNIIKTVTNGFQINADSVLSKENITYILISIIIIVLLLRYISRNNTFIKMDSRIMLSLAIAGATSNLIDRAFRGVVINYINLSFFTPINLAYVYILITWVGMAVILTKTHFANKQGSSKATRANAKGYPAFSKKNRSQRKFFQKEPVKMKKGK